MSAIAIVFRRGEAPLDHTVMDTCLTVMSHHGPDGHVRKRIDTCEIGQLHFHTLPEADEPKGPWVCPDTGRLVGFCGRLDNREELMRDLRLKQPLSDDHLAWRCYLAWGAMAFERMVGRFILAAADCEDRRLMIARDALGDEPLYYALDSTRLIAASEPWAVCQAAGLPPEPNHEHVVDFLQNRWPSTCHSFFEGIRELPPGHYATVGPTGWQCQRYWQFEPDPVWRTLPEGEVYAAFKTVLSDAVSARMRSRYPVAISLSGGLDSSSVAWAAMQAGSLTGYSWRFSRFAQSDEGDTLSAVVKTLDIPHESIAGDNLVTGFDHDGIPDGLDPSGPLTNSVHTLKQALYQRASNDGSRVILTGDSADELFLGRWYWLRDLLRYRSGITPTVPVGYLRDLVSRDGEAWQALRLVLSDRVGLRRYLPKKKPPWLSDDAWHRMAPYFPTPLVPPALTHQVSFDYALGAYRSRYSTYEIAANTRSGVDRRCPYRDRRLVSFILSLPAWYYSRPPENKRLIRRAMKDIFPANVINQPKTGSLGVLFGAGLLDAKDAIASNMQQGSRWRDYLDSRRVLSALDGFRGVGKNNPVPDGVLWNAICLQSWLRLLGSD